MALERRLVRGTVVRRHTKDSQLAAYSLFQIAAQNRRPARRSGQSKSRRRPMCKGSETRNSPARQTHYFYSGAVPPRDSLVPRIFEGLRNPHQFPGKAGSSNMVSTPPTPNSDWWRNVGIESPGNRANAQRTTTETDSAEQNARRWFMCA